MASLKSQRSLFTRPIVDKSSEVVIANMSSLKINKKLDFDSCSEDDLPRSSSPDRNLQKKLIFDFSEDDFELSDALSSPVKLEKKTSLVHAYLSPIESRILAGNKSDNSLLELRDLNTSGMESMRSVSDKFSPCRTRSGKIYTSVEKRKNVENSVDSVSKLPTPVFMENLHRSSSRHCSGASAGIATPRSTRIQTSHLRVQEVRLNLLQRDLINDMMDFEEPTCNEPPPLNYNKRPMSRLLHINTDSLSLHHTPIDHDDEDSPWQLQTPANPHSPPTNEVKAMKLFDKSPTLGSSPTGAFTVPKFGATKSRLLFAAGDNGDTYHPRRTSAPAGMRVTFGHTEINSCEVTKERKRKRVANINPFTPTSMLASIKKKFRSEPELNHLCNSYVVPAEENFHRNSLNISSQFAADCDFENAGGNPAKRLRVSDINISRYEEEFVEIKEIASGSFGKVKVARHCLDGMVYAIKVTRNKIYGNTHEERVAMNEVFAHSSLMKHKHVVRYYNSWVENGHVYIQNEYCEGGSLANLIKEYRRLGRRFPEGELKKIMIHIAKGLQYIHSKQLVHLDVKPENIFISLDHLTPCPASHQSAKNAEASNENASGNTPAEQSQNAAANKNIESAKIRPVVERGDCSGNESTDSGHASGCDARFYISKSLSNTINAGIDERISYKIGDLGHVAPIYGEHIPEEGDCRYMAPELLADDVDREKLAKADIFSLGLTLYEAASLQELPKNSLEDSMYERLKGGDLPFIEGYSKEFNQLLKSLVCPDENMRPSAVKIVSHPFLRSNTMSKSRSQLYKELKETKARLRQLELELSAQKEPVSWLARFPPQPSSSPHSTPVSRHSPVAGKPSQSKRLLVGRGTQKSLSCLL